MLTVALLLMPSFYLDGGVHGCACLHQHDDLARLGERLHAHEINHSAHKYTAHQSSLKRHALWCEQLFSTQDLLSLARRAHAQGAHDQRDDAVQYQTLRQALHAWEATDRHSRAQTGKPLWLGQQVSLNCSSISEDSARRSPSLRHVLRG